ncbi:MAG: hypothetical protein IKH11_09330 [Bacteroidales bacterium]|nr:hypothetical protein [Bacteroidales bacterium]
MKLLTIILAAVMDIIPSGDAVLQQLQKRDSILVADQLRYGVTLDGVEAGTAIALPDFSADGNDTLTIIGGWQLDTLVRGKEVRSRDAKSASKILLKPFSLRASIVIAPFEEGRYVLPDIPVIKTFGDKADTLVFKGLEMEVKTMPVDTATFVIHDIKGQIKYPVTFKEVLPWIAGGLLLAALLLVLIRAISKARERKAQEGKPKDPAYVVALRELEKYRSKHYWAPDKQKSFYSGITDALKFYMDDRFGVDAPEMTTAELFDALKGDKDITPEMFGSLKDLFERADFVKFAKHLATDEENAEALPLAVRFVTSTYQADIEKEASGQEAAGD